MFNNLALLYTKQGRLNEAEPLYLRSLAMVERTLGPEHLDVATSLNNLAGLYSRQGRYAERRIPLSSICSDSKGKVGDDHAEMSVALNNLGTLFVDLGRYEDGEQLLRRSLDLRERQLGPQHLSIATCLNNLAGVYRKCGKYAAAAPLYLRALTIWEANQGENDPDVAVALNNLGVILYEQARYTEAERCFSTGIRHSKECFRSVAPGRGRVSQQSSCSVSDPEALQRSWTNVPRIPKQSVRKPSDRDIQRLPRDSATLRNFTGWKGKPSIRSRSIAGRLTFGICFGSRSSGYGQQPG